MIDAVENLTVLRLFVWFGFKPMAFSASEGKLFVSVGNKKRERIAVDRLIHELRFKKTILGSSLRIPTAKGALEVSWLNHESATAAYRSLHRCGYQHVLPQVDMAARQIAAVLTKGYLRTSRFRSVQMAALHAFDLYKVMPCAEYLSDGEFRQFGLVNTVAHWGKGDIEAYRGRYVSRMIDQHSAYFDRVESNPLTPKQREACVIDEDNNLVLAGAGTGKTSVMIGRAGFLLASSQAQPREILMLAFGNKAAAEMQERLDERLGENQQGVTASTFHKLGKDIIAQVEGAQPSISAIAEDDKKLQREVSGWFERRIDNQNYRQGLLKYFEHYLYSTVNPFDFQSEGEYYEYIKDNEIRTLKGELVKSVGECLVANHLFMLGVEYRYEADYRMKTRSLEFRQYAPDFYLPEQDIYIEFYGIDRAGNTAPFVDREQYHEGIKWKRELHREHETALIELYHYENIEGILLHQLRTHLTTAGIEFNPLPEEAVLATLREFGAVKAFAILLSQMLRLYRSSWFDQESRAQKVNQSADPGQFAAALELLLPILEDYENYLANEDKIDFDDMIGKALRYVKQGKFTSRWRYILVDEFQDISDPRAQLVKAIKQASAECSLFCVGDDWQAIYRFTGSDIGFTSHFESHFGETKTISLDKTFRFNNSISDVASRFIQANPAQLKKEMTTLKQVKTPAVVLHRETAREESGDTKNDNRLYEILQHISERQKEGQKASVYLLARYWFSLPEKHQINELSQIFPNLDIQNQSIHASKGKEADYVVLLGLINGKHGFPSKKITHPLLEALLPKAESYAFAEERRLFYVAITRAKERAYLVADMAVASDFVVELIEKEYPLELNEFNVSLIQQLFQHIRCKGCSTGAMVFRENQQSRFQRFLGCTNYPLCKHTEEVCHECGQAMEHIGRFRVCIDTACRTWVPKCTKCSTDMALRKGRYGEFWSCRNWRSEGVSCESTENTIAYDGPMPSAIA
jgi:DNA helicase-4